MSTLLLLFSLISHQGIAGLLLLSRASLAWVVESSISRLPLICTKLPKCTYGLGAGMRQVSRRRLMK